MRFIRYAAFSLCVCALAQTPPARGSEIGELTLKDLVAEALVRNPEIRAAQRGLEAAGQRPAQVKELPDPTVSLGWNSTTYPWPGAGLGKDPVANLTFMASQEIPYPGKLRLKSQIATQEMKAEAQDYRAVSLGVLARLKTVFFNLQHTDAVEGIITRNLELSRSILRATEERYAAGKAAMGDVLRAQTQVTLNDVRRIQLNRERLTQAAEINRLLNRPVDTKVERTVEPSMTPVQFTEEELADMAKTSAPSIARSQKLIERAGLAVELSRKNYYPDITLNGGFFPMGSLGQMYMFRADVKLPLRRNRVRAEVAERSSELSRAKYSYEDTSRTLEFQIKESFLATQAAEKLVELYTATVIPQAKLSAEAAFTAYETGSGDLLGVLNSQTAVTEYEMNYHEQMEALHLALVRLEEITGVEILQ